MFFNQWYLLPKMLMWEYSLGIYVKKSLFSRVFGNKQLRKKINGLKDEPRR